MSTEKRKHIASGILLILIGLLFLMVQIVPGLKVFQKFKGKGIKRFRTLSLGRACSRITKRFPSLVVTNRV